ncbi:MAG: hypothetical protein AB1896_04135 [Thermodesulfobacteriota bacterium]
MAGLLSSALLLLMILLGVNPAAAGAGTGAPPDLAEWQDWVLFGQEERRCPLVYNDGGDLRCLWPSRLELNIEPGGGRFRQEWLAFAPTWAPLPGGPGRWPTNVEVDQARVPVVEKDGRPAVRLEPGGHTITGAFDWNEVPETLLVPPASGLVSLTLAGRPVDFPVWDKGGRLWLQKRTAPQGEEDRLEVRVQRLLTDSIPLIVTNLLKVDVSGRAREVTLADVLLEGTTAMSLESPLPARIDPDGSLKMQARPGRWEIQIVSRFMGPVHRLGPVKGPFGREIWAFQAQNHLRLVEITKATPIDPGQTDLPDEWKEFPAFILDPGQEMVFKEIRRGDPDPAPDRLDLERTWWLDFDGRGYTVQDRITGAMSRQWYLAMNKPGALGRVSVSGQDMLITRQGREGLPGVELRLGELDLTADSRIEGTERTLPAVGWDHDFQSVQGRLNLPPGWRLITVTGVDVVPGTWFDRWTLLDLFLVLIIAMAVFKLFGWRWGLLALVTLGLIYHEPDSPRIVWLNLLAALALLKVLPPGWARRLANLWRLGSVIVLVVMAIPFIIGQVRVGVFPQLERYYAGPTGYMADKVEEEVEYDVSTGKEGGLAPRAPAPPSLAKKEAPMVQKMEDQQAYEQAQRRQQALAQDPNALIQTGPGLPAWEWLEIYLNWTGPVKKDQQIRLYLLSPGVNLALALIRVVLLTIMVVGLIDLRRWWRGLDKARAVPAAATAAMLIFLLVPGVAWAVNEPAQAQQGQQMFPNQPLNQPWIGPPGGVSGVECPTLQLLNELRERLLPAPKCLPYCAYYPRLDVAVTPDSLRLLVEVHALARAAAPLPGSLESWLPDQVLLDGEPAAGLMKDDQGTLWFLVPEGIHHVVLLGRTPPANNFQLPMPLRPGQVAVSAEGWEVTGLGPEGQVQASLQFTRLESREGDEELRGSVLPPFLQVERTLSLGLTWEVRTRVTRLTPPGHPVVVEVPLLPGESVTTAGVRVAKGRAQVNMDPRAEEFSWSSTLEVTPEILLKAPEDAPWTEAWVLDASPIWHCEPAGIPVIHHQDDAGRWEPRWRPWPGESVTIKVTRPPAIPGQTLTIDAAGLDWTPGRRSNKAGLNLEIRASQGGQHKVVLPPGAELQVVKINGRTQPIGQEGRDVVVPLQPGRQTVYLEWHEKAGSSWFHQAPEVKAGEKTENQVRFDGRAVNADVIFHLPANRWILWAGGPRLGPAVLFWSYLAAVILAALALGRIQWTPLKTRHWLLLGLGLTQVHPLMAIVIVGWLLVLGLREKRTPADHWLVFDLAQLGLALWTLVALIFLYLAVHDGLLGIPQMQISGNGSYAGPSGIQLNWSQDRVLELMPRPWAVSLPKIIFNGLMLVWAVWLALSLLGWLRWGWRSFGLGGLWKKPAWRSKTATPPDLPAGAAGEEKKTGPGGDFVIE